jgi:DNA processing protein
MGTPTDDAAAWLRLVLTRGLGSDNIRRLLKAFDTPQGAIDAGMGAWVSCVGQLAAQALATEDTAQAVEKVHSWCAQSDTHFLLTIADPDYPQALLNSDDPPLLLYGKGQRDLLAQPAFAIVGSRNASIQGQEDARAFAAALAQAGWLVVSGLALGIDAAAHAGALEAGNGTLAVIGTGIDRIYPPRNEALAHEIARCGLLLSEWPLGTPPVPSNFPRRNRIIAGLCRGCLVVEAAERSGSLITARLAAEAGRDVFALPGSIHAPLHKGCHQLIKQGAKLVETASDILDELGACAAGTARSPAAQRVPATRLKSDEDDPVLTVMAHDPCDLEALSVRTGLSTDLLLSRLLALELAGRISTLPGGRYQRLN